MVESIGFFEESTGVRSMTRLCAFLMTLAVIVLAAALAAYLLAAHYLTREKPDAGVIGAFAAPITALAGGIWGALKSRTGGTT